MTTLFTRILVLSSLLCLVPFALCRAASDAYYPYLQGLLLEHAGDATEALSHYEKVVKMDPQALEAFRDIAQIQLRRGNSDAALKAAERARDLEPKDPESYLFLGNIYVARGDVQKAVEQYEKVLSLNPQHPRALENLGHFYSTTDPDKALQYFQRYLAVARHDATIQFQMGLINLKKGNRAEAEKWLRNSLQEEPNQIASHLALAELYESQKSTAAAVVQLQNAIRHDSRNAALLLKLGSMYYQLREWPKAKEQFQKAAELQPQDVSALYWLARTSEEMQNWGEAMSYASKAYDLSNESQFLPLLAYYATVQKKNAEAIRWLEEASNRNVDSPNLNLYLGMAYLEEDQFEKAKNSLEKARIKQPKEPQVLFHLGMAYDRLGDFPNSEKTFRDLIAVDSGNAVALNYLGYSLADRSLQLPEAESFIRRALAVEPDNAAYLDSLGWVLYKQNKISEAIPALKEAAQRGQDALIWDHLADAYRKADDPTRALASWEKSLAMKKDSAVQKKADEAWKTVESSWRIDALWEALREQYRGLDRLEGKATFKGSADRFPINAQGSFRLQRDPIPEVNLEVRDKRLQMPVRFRQTGGKLTWSPPDAEVWKAQAQEVATLISSYFLSQLGREWNINSIQTKRVGNELQLKMESEEIFLDLRRQVPTRWIRKDSTGAVREVRWSDYEWRQGFWLPRQIDWKESQTKLQLRGRITDWQLNKP